MKKVFYYQVLALCVCFTFSQAKSFGQKTETNNIAQCLKEKENLKSLEKKLDETQITVSVLDGFISNTKLHLESFIKNPKLHNDQKQTDIVLNALTSEIARLKDDIKNKNPGFEYSELKLIANQGKYDFIAEQRLKSQFGESVDLKNNDLLKTVAIFEGKQTKLKNYEKNISNDIQLTRDRLSDLKCELLTSSINQSAGTLVNKVELSKLQGDWEKDKELAVQQFGFPIQFFHVEINSITGEWGRLSTTNRNGKITGGSYDERTKTLSFTYVQNLDKKTGTAKLLLTETETEYKLRGTWTHNDGSGSGSLMMKKLK